MVVVLDTDALAPSDRVEAVVATVQDASAPTHVVLKPSDRPVHAHLDAWQFGQVSLVQAQMPDLELVRTPKQVRVTPSSLVAVEVQRRACSRLTQGDVQHELTPGDLFFMDFDLPYELDWHGGGTTALFLPEDQLGIPKALIRSVLGTVRHSALASLVTKQIALMGESAEALHADPAAPELGAACIEMVRALFSSAAGGSEDSTALPEDVLVQQVRDYVRRHLLDPDLCPAGIARAHHISVRYLYKLCERAGLSLEQWIITERLERARNILARPDARQRSIAAVAHRHGFRDQTHFARRFRAAYGMAPSEWRRANSSPADAPLTTIRTARPNR
ncbi:helix-turn-helix domain-containing protein [Nocardia ninae]|uniref:HTH araC/xylS-type domain-containing protein n=1 Tax=Nocardia ninae NBRC 108245 TaxID=1210091 RepID=A0A511MIH9_9NOCA|nr:helix-turn-helix domain-containing protein [Nocardia ninae]GEM40442.1 hypothetical protein NN4_49610 [Nocardia ninae NBRC 108245]